MKIQLLLLDDHALFRSGIAMVLAAGLSADVERYEAATLEQALACPLAHIDLILLDVHLQDGNGLEGIEVLKQLWPAAKVLVVSAIEQAHIVAEATARGADAFICKSASPGRMLEMVTALLGLGDDPDGPIHLTPRQVEVLRLVSQGLSNKRIGQHLHLSENTVRGHVQATLLALRAENRSEAAFVARRLGLVS